MRISAGRRVPIKLWLDELEPGALEQAEHLADLPWVFHHVALMPDAHQGFGMPIGGVAATEEVVIPNAVGVDIGCGMIAVKSRLEAVDRGALQGIIEDIRREIPLGFSHHESPQEWEGFDEAPQIPVIRRELDSARRQLGSLGGGNHFIEFQKGSDGRIWIMLHSGSRNFGYTIAREFAETAKREAKKRGLSLPDTGLAPLFLDSAEGQAYFEAMSYAQCFAAASRKRMMERVMEILLRYYPQAGWDDEVNIHHNFAARERHFGRSVIVHRKGATSARKGERGIIPGSQGSASYIVEGLGNPESFHSCSHGAGRRMGRKEAQRKLDFSREKTLLEQQQIIHSLRSKKDLDEAAGAYKDIDEVMAQQQDLVRPVVTLQPLAVVKG